MADKKSIIQDAKSDFDEIRKFALEGAKRDLEKEIDEKLKLVIEGVLNEDLSIAVGDTKIDVDYNEEDEEEISVTKDGEYVVGDGEGEEGFEDSDEVSVSDSTDDDVEFGDEMGDSDFEGGEDETEFGGEDDDEEIDLLAGDEDEDDEEIDIDEDYFEEQEAVVSNAPQQAAPQAPAAPVQDAGEAAGEEMEEAPVEPSLADIGSKLDMIMGMLQGDDQGGEDGEIEIVDDEETAPQAPAQGQAPVQGQPVMEEFDLDEEFSTDETMFEIEDDLIGELEIEDEEMGIDEVGGLSFSAEKLTGRNQRFSTGDRHHAPQAPMHESKKAQKESKVDELLKENGSLKTEIEDFQKSFIELRKQFNEVQTFNAKLAYVNKILVKGGLSNEEKVRISERFDNVKTIDEAEKLYRVIVKESNLRTPGSTPSKIKPTQTNVVKSTSTPLYESAEVMRMKRLINFNSSEE